MAKNLETLNVKITADNKGLKTALNNSASQTKASVGRMQRALGSLRRSIRPISIGIAAVGASVVALGAVLTKALGEVDKLAKAISSTSFSSERFQELSFILQQTGASADGATKILQQLDVRITRLRNGTGALATELRGSNEALRDALVATTSTDEAFEVLRQSFLDGASAAEQVSLATTLVGNRLAGPLRRALLLSDNEMLKLTNQARDLGLVLDRETLDASEKASDQLAVLSRTIRSRLLPVAVRIIKPLAEFAEKNAELVGDSILRGVDNLASGFKRIRDFINSIDLPRLEALAALGLGGVVVKGAASGGGALGRIGDVAAGAVLGGGLGKRAPVNVPDINPFDFSEEEAAARRNAKALNAQIAKNNASITGRTLNVLKSLGSGLLALTRGFGVTLLVTAAVSTAFGVLNGIFKSFNVDLTDFIPSLRTVFNVLKSIINALVALPKLSALFGEAIVVGIRLGFAKITDEFINFSNNLDQLFVDLFNKILGSVPFINIPKIPDVQPDRDAEFDRRRGITTLSRDLKRLQDESFAAVRNILAPFNQPASTPGSGTPASSSLPPGLTNLPDPVTPLNGSVVGSGETSEKLLDSLKKKAGELKNTLSDIGLSDLEKELRSIERNRLETLGEVAAQEEAVGNLRERVARENKSINQQILDLTAARKDASDEELVTIDKTIASLREVRTANNRTLETEQGILDKNKSRLETITNQNAELERQIAIKKFLEESEDRLNGLTELSSDQLRKDLEFLEAQLALKQELGASEEELDRINNARLQTQRDLNTALINEQAQLGGIKGVIGGLRQEFNELSLTAGELGREIGDTLVRGVENFSDSFISAMANGQSATDALRASLRQLGIDLAQTLAKAGIQSALFGAGGGGEGQEAGGIVGAITSAFSGGRASGGPIAPGKIAVVGEKGPELAFGGSAGKFIIPNGALPVTAINAARGAGGSPQTNVSVIVNTQPGTTADVSKRQDNGRTLIVATVRDIVNSDIRSNGPIAKTLQSVTTTRRRTG